MKKRVLIALVVVLALAATASVTWASGPWYVDDDCGPSPDGSATNPFCTIQDAVDAASDGDTIYVANGNYNATTSNSTERPVYPGEWWFVTIDKSLNLVGESRDGVILDGTGLQAEVRKYGHLGLSKQCDGQEPHYSELHADASNRRLLRLICNGKVQALCVG